MTKLLNLEQVAIATGGVYVGAKTASGPSKKRLEELINSGPFSKTWKHIWLAKDTEHKALLNHLDLFPDAYTKAYKRMVKFGFIKPNRDVTALLSKFGLYVDDGDYDDKLSKVSLFSSNNGSVFNKLMDLDSAVPELQGSFVYRFTGGKIKVRLNICGLKLVKVCEDDFYALQKTACLLVKEAVAAAKIKLAKIKLAKMKNK